MRAHANWHHFSKKAAKPSELPGNERVGAGEEEERRGRKAQHKGRREEKLINPVRSTAAVSGVNITSHHLALPRRKRRPQTFDTQRCPCTY